MQDRDRIDHSSFSVAKSSTNVRLSPSFYLGLTKKQQNYHIRKGKSSHLYKNKTIESKYSYEITNQTLNQQSKYLKLEKTRLGNQQNKYKKILASKIKGRLANQLDLKYFNEEDCKGWGGEISQGLKYQYTQLKTEYDEKCKKIDQLKKCSQQFIQYQGKINNLIAKNKYLKELIQKGQWNSTLQIKLLKKRFSKEKQQRNIEKHNLRQAKLKLKILQQESYFKIWSNEQISKILGSAFPDYSKFSNKQWSMNFQIPKFEKVEQLSSRNNQLKKDLAKLEKKMQKLCTKNQKQISQLNNECQQQLKSDQQHYQQITSSADHQIRQLQKKRHHLKILLNSWRPNQRADSKQAKRRILSRKQSTQKKSMRQNTSQFSQLLTQQVIQRQDQEQSENNQIQSGSCEDNLELNHSQIKKQGSIRNRNIQKFQIQEEAEFLYYLVLNKNLTLNEARLIFYSESSPNELLSMKEVKQILKANFNLNQKTSHLLSRYMIEEATQSYVYTHQENQQKAVVIKSIFLQLIGSYEPLTKEQIKQADNFYSFYSQNLQLALKTSFKNGLVSKNKFIQLLGNIGVEDKGRVFDYWVAIISAHSENLQELQWKYLFDKNK